MAAEEIAVDPYRGKAQKLRILAENSQDSKLDRLVLTAMLPSYGRAGVAQRTRQSGRQRPDDRQSCGLTGKPYTDEALLLRLLRLAAFRRATEAGDLVLRLAGDSDVAAIRHWT